MGKLVADDSKVAFDWGTVFNMLLCLFLAACLFLFIRNNRLLDNGGQNLWHLETLIMFGVLGIPFVLTCLHFVRNLRRSDNHRADTGPE